MWVNVGRGQFHLPTRGTPRWCAARPALVVPDLEALLKRLDYAKKYLEGTKFSFREAGDVVETTCPWGNRIRVHAPDPARFGPMRVGMPYVEFDIPAGTDLAAIAQFYARSSAASPASRRTSAAPMPGPARPAESKVIYRETDSAACRNTTGTTSRSRWPTSPARTRSCWSAA